MSTATKIDPATDAKLADLEKKLEHAHRIQAHLVTAFDALAALDDINLDSDMLTALEDEWATARMHTRRAKTQIAATIEKLKAKLSEVRGW